MIYTRTKEKRKLDCLRLFPWKPINLNGITEYICVFFPRFATCFLSDVIRRDRGTGSSERLNSYRKLTRWVFALWDDTEEHDNREYLLARRTWRSCRSTLNMAPFLSLRRPSFTSSFKAFFLYLLSKLKRF